MLMMLLRWWSDIQIPSLAKPLVCATVSTPSSRRLLWEVCHNSDLLSVQPHLLHNVFQEQAFHLSSKIMML